MWLADQSHRKNEGNNTAKFADSQVYSRPDVYTVYSMKKVKNAKKEVQGDDKKGDGLLSEDEMVLKEYMKMLAGLDQDKMDGVCWTNCGERENI